jgi:hypothetical protein
MSKAVRRRVSVIVVLGVVGALMPKLDGYEVVDSDVLGELQWSVYFRLWKHEGDGHEEQNCRRSLRGAAQGRQADRSRRHDVGLRIRRDRLLPLVPLDARDTIPRRQPQGILQRHRDVRQIWVRRVGSRVFVVDGGDRALLDTLVAKTTFD